MKAQQTQEVELSTNLHVPAVPPPTQQGQSTNPPAAPPPTQPLVYADIRHSTNPPAAPPPTEPNLIIYAHLKQSTSQPGVLLHVSNEQVSSVRLLNFSL